MNDDQPGLDAECRGFTKFLVGREPDEYILAKYREAHRHLALEAEPRSFEAALLERATRGPRRTRLADAYSRIFLPQSVLRKKLVLLLAILESRSPFCHEIDRLPSRAVPLVWLGLAARGCFGVITLLLGTLWIGPGHRRHSRERGGH